VSFCGSAEASYKRPPSLPAFSQSVTACPRSHSVRAAVMPAGPPPMTSTFFFLRARGISRYLTSRPAWGLTAQRSWAPILGPRRQSRQRRHGLISSALPSLALVTRSWSAMSARAMATISALPEARISSASSMLVMPPTTDTGREIPFLIIAAVSTFSM
jgi:hypothetical protein